MEFSFKAYDFLTYIDQEPQLVVVWAAFGTPLLMLALALPFYLWRKTVFPTLQKATSEIVYVSLSITWIVGFLFTILLLISGFPGIKIALIWLALLLCCLCFSLFNRTMIHQFITEDYKKLKINNAKRRYK